MRLNDARSRRHSGYWAFLLHRWSGLALAAFLPAHFWVLGRALQGEAALEGAIRWAEQPLVKFAEVVLVTALALHLTGGLRLLVLEFLPWREWQRALLAAAGALAVGVGLAFAMNVV